MFVGYNRFVEVTNIPRNKRVRHEADKEVDLRVKDTILRFDVDSDEEDNYDINLPGAYDAMGLMYFIYVRDTGSNGDADCAVTVKDAGGDTVKTFATVGDTPGQAHWVLLLSVGEMWIELADGDVSP